MGRRVTIGGQTRLVLPFACRSASSGRSPVQEPHAGQFLQCGARTRALKEGGPGMNQVRPVVFLDTISDLIIRLHFIWGSPKSSSIEEPIRPSSKKQYKGPRFK